MLNKRGFELSINFIVILVLGLLIIGLSLFFLGKLINNSITITAQVDTKLQNELKQTMVFQKETISVLDLTKSTSPGKEVPFVIGVRNINEDQINIYFAISNLGNPLLSVINNLERSSAASINPDDYLFRYIAAKPLKGIQAGQAPFDLTICADEVMYDPQTIPESNQVCAGGFYPYPEAESKLRMYVLV